MTTEIEALAAAAADRLADGLGPGGTIPAELYALVRETLDGDPALAALEEQARGGGATERTTRRVADALADAVESDPAREERLRHVLAGPRRDGGTSGQGTRSVTIGGEVSGIVSTGDGTINVQRR
ncbi:hypothetical protein ACIBF1_16125 [Spirillospora sp. NPDC050679]